MMGGRTALIAIGDLPRRWPATHGATRPSRPQPSGGSRLRRRPV